MKKALICGISGQDGAYLAKLLLSKGYEVFGTSRDAQINPFSNLHKLDIARDIQLTSMALNDFRSVLQVLKTVNPDEIYNLAGQSSVGLSFMQPMDTMESIVTGTLNILEGIRFLGNDVKFYNAGSGESFGNTGDKAASEDTPFHPRSPYAVAKSTAYWTCANYREAYSIYACTGLLFNHESPLRPERFVTKKIIRAACAIAAGNQSRLTLGNIDIKRDWGWAPEYVEAMWLMLQQPSPQDFVISTGRSNSLKEFLATAFQLVELEWKDYVIQTEQLVRPTDLTGNRGNPSKARQILNWVPKHDMTDVVKLMVDAELANSS